MSNRRNLKFTIVLTRDESNPHVYNAAVPALPGCVSFGKTKKSAYKHAQEAIELYLEDLEASGEPVPEEIESFEILLK
jgi:antitoxin HicB